MTIHAASVALGVGQEACVLFRATAGVLESHSLLSQYGVRRVQPLVAPSFPIDMGDCRLTGTYIFRNDCMIKLK